MFCVYCNRGRKEVITNTTIRKRRRASNTERKGLQLGGIEPGECIHEVNGSKHYKPSGY